MKRVLCFVAVALLAVVPVAAVAQENSTTPSTSQQQPATGCSVSGSAGCLNPPAGAQPNSTPDTTLEGGTSGSTSGSGTLGNTSPSGTGNPGDSSGGGLGGNSGGGAAGPLPNSN